MKYIPQFDQVMVIDLGLKWQHGFMLDLVINAATWCAQEEHEGKTYYWLEYSKVIEELPTVFGSKQAISRIVNTLKAMGLVDTISISRSLYFRAHPVLEKYWYKTKHDNETAINEYSSLIEGATGAKPKVKPAKNHRSENGTKKKRAKKAKKVNRSENGTVKPDKKDDRSENGTIKGDDRSDNGTKEGTTVPKMEHHCSENGTKPPDIVPQTESINILLHPSTNIISTENDPSLTLTGSARPRLDEIEIFLKERDWHGVIDGKDFWNKKEEQGWLNISNWRVTLAKWYHYQNGVNILSNEITAAISQPMNQRHWQTELAYSLYLMTDSSTWNQLDNTGREFEIKKNYRMLKNGGMRLTKLPELNGNGTKSDDDCYLEKAKKASLAAANKEIAEALKQNQTAEAQA